MCQNTKANCPLLSLLRFLHLQTKTTESLQYKSSCKLDLLIDITESSRAFSFKETKGGNTHVKAQRTTTHQPEQGRMAF